MILKAVSFCITVWLFVTLTFFAIKALPGGPFDLEKPLPENVRANQIAKYKLDEPIITQYFSYLNQLTHFEFGESIRHSGNESVKNILKNGFLVSFTLGISAFLLSTTFGFLAACIMATTHFWGNILSKLVLILIATPSFLYAALLIWFFSLKLKILPPALWPESFLNGWPHLVLPVLCLSLKPFAMIAQMLSHELKNILKQEYIKTAIAKGLPTRLIYYKHALKNAVVPTLTYMGPVFSHLITGSFVVESIFVLPGLGNYFVNSILDRDYNLVLGTTVLFGVIILFVTYIIDFLSIILDPRQSRKK